MGDDDHGHALSRQFNHHVEHLLDHLGSRAEVGSSKSITFGSHAEAAGNGDPLLLTARKLAGVFSSLFADADLLKDNHRCFFSFSFGNLSDPRARG